MFVRFAIMQKDQRSHVERGLFHAAEALRADKELSRFEEALVSEVFDWFNRSLPHPTRLARSTRPHAEAKAISWFKDTAGDFIARMEELVAVLREHGYVVQR